MAQAIVQDAVTTLAAGLMGLACEHGIDSIVDRHLPVTWRQGVKFVNDPNPYTKRLGYVVLLTALVETPGIAERLLEALCDELRGDPDAF